VHKRLGLLAGLELAQAELHAVRDHGFAELAHCRGVHDRVVEAQLHHQRLAGHAGVGDLLAQPFGLAGRGERERRLRHVQAQQLVVLQVLADERQRLLHHPAVDVHDQRASLGHRDDLGGRMQLAVGVAHAQQGLVLRHVAAGDRDHRLVVHHQAVVLERLAHLQQQRGFLHGLGHARGLEAAYAALGGARLAGDLLGGIDHRAGFVEAMLEGGDADRHAQPQRMPERGKGRLHHGLAQLHRQRFQRRLVVLVVHHQVAAVAEACRGHFAQRRAEQPRKVTEQRLKRGQANALAQRAQVLDFDEQQAAFLLAAMQRLVHLLEHGSAVDQAGGRILVGATRPPCLDGARTAHPRLHRGNQVSRPDRLGEEVVAAGLDRVELHVVAALAGQEHDRRVQEDVLLADQRGQLDAARAGHVQVHQHQVGAELLHRRHYVERLEHHQ
jgi:hypothetical protein